jgi:hypothetical protein
MLCQSYLVGHFHRRGTNSPRIWYIHFNIKPTVTQSRLVQRFAVDIVKPKVQEMDEKEHMDPTIIRALFEQGVNFPHILVFAATLTLHLAYGDRN